MQGNLNIFPKKRNFTWSTTLDTTEKEALLEEGLFFVI